MANNKNFFSIEGIIYAKPSRIVKSTKNEKEYEFKSIILELKRDYKGKTYIELPEFQLGYGVVDDGFDVGDPVQISFVLVGKEISSTFHKTELKALYIKHTNLQSGDDTRDVSGKPIYRKEKATIPTTTEEDEDLPF